MLSSLSFQNQVNAVGGVALLIIAGYFTVELGRSREVTPCSTRFSSMTQMSLQKPGGMPLSPAELEARAGLGERNVMEKASVRKADGSPSPFVLDVKVGGPQSADSGIDFRWTPNGLAKADAVCLAYSIYVPADFDFASGGALPGVFGEATGSMTGAQRGFASRLVFGGGGELGIDVNVSDTTSSAQDGAAQVRWTQSGTIERGRWTAVEQEIILNNANAKDGVVRIWTGGRLRLETLDMAWRATAAMRVSGMLSEIGYNGVQTATNKKPSIISISAPRLAFR
jgi:hypothetical protein